MLLNVNYKLGHKIWGWIKLIVGMRVSAILVTFRIIRFSLTDNSCKFAFRRNSDKPLLHASNYQSVMI